MPLSALIVEDEAEMRELLSMTLRKLGIEEIYEAEEAQEAIEVFSIIDVNVVFLDLNLPGEDGFTVLEFIRTRNPQAFVIIVSGESSVARVRKAIALGAQGFVVKPYQPSKINDLVQRYLKSVEPE